MTEILSRDTFKAGLVAEGTTTVPDPVNDTDAVNKQWALANNGTPIYQYTKHTPASASADAEYSSDTADKAIDGSTSTFWQTPFPPNEHWLRLDLGSAKTVSRLRLNGDAAPPTVYVESSTDNTAWTLRHTISSPVSGWTQYDFTAATARYWRVRGTLAYWVVREIEYWGSTLVGTAVPHAVYDEGTLLTPRAGLNLVGSGVTATDDSANDRTIVTVPNPLPAGGTTSQVLAKTSAADYATAWTTPAAGATTLDSLTDVDTTGAANGSVLGYSVGAYTWAGLPTTVTESAHYSSFPASNVWDNDPATYWYTNDTSPAWTVGDFGAPITVSRLFALGVGGVGPWSFEGSLDGTTWTTINSAVTPALTPGNTYDFTPVTYRYFKFSRTDNWMQPSSFTLYRSPANTWGPVAAATGSGLDQAAADARYLQLTGGTLNDSFEATNILEEGVEGEPDWTYSGLELHLSRSGMNQVDFWINAGLYTDEDEHSADISGSVTQSGSTLHMASDRTDIWGHNSMIELSESAGIALRSYGDGTISVGGAGNTAYISIGDDGDTVAIGYLREPTEPADAASKQYVDARTPKITVASTAPSSPAVNDIWVDTT